MNYKMISAAAALCVLLTGCASSDRRPEQNVASAGHAQPQPATVTGAAESEPEDAYQLQPPQPQSQPQTEVSIPTAQVTTSPDAEEDLDVFYDEVHEQFDLSEEELGFVRDSLFVGDSICSGFAEYGIVPREHVAARGNLGSRSFFDYTFTFRGREEQTYDQVLSVAKPRYVLLSMGMNDVNMVDEDVFCENYSRIIDATLQGSGADIFVAAITPVRSKFCGNSVIDSFNDRLREYIADKYPERVHFIDFAQYLKNDEGKLRSCLHSGDGVHLGPYCYYIALWEMHRALMEAGLWDGTRPLGTFEAEPTEEAADAAVTAEPEEVAIPTVEAPEPEAAVTADPEEPQPEAPEITSTTAGIKVE